jgi:hypothetical protein
LPKLGIDNLTTFKNPDWGVGAFCPACYLVIFYGAIFLYQSMKNVKTRYLAALPLKGPLTRLDLPENGMGEYA